MYIICLEKLILCIPVFDYCIRYMHKNVYMYTSCEKICCFPASPPYVHKA